MTVPTDYMPIIISSGFFFFAILVLVGVMVFIRHNTKKQVFIEKIRKEGKSTIDFQRAVTTDGIGNRFVNFLGSLGQKVSTKEKDLDYSKLRPLFLKAGIRQENAPAVFWGTKAVLAVLFPASLLLLRFVIPDVVFPAKKLILILVFMSMFGFYLPNFWIRLKIAKRRDLILKGFPDALDLMVVCVEAGMGLDSAITRVARELELSNKILSDELKLYNLEMRAGKLRKDALNNLAMRTDVEEVKNLVTLLIQTDKFGTSIGQALSVFSDTMRTQRFQRAEEKAAKIPVKLLFPLILFIFPSLFVVILGPALINIFRALKGMH